MILPLMLIKGICGNMSENNFPFLLITSMLIIKPPCDIWIAFLLPITSTSLRFCTLSSRQKSIVFSSEMDATLSAYPI